MDFTFEIAEKSELKIAFEMLSSTAKNLAEKNINQWQYWKNPPAEKVTWITNGFNKKEFYFIKTIDDKTIGMFRLSHKDLIYWGEMNDKSVYVHSLIIKKAFSGNTLGKKVLKKIAVNAVNEQFQFLRLDCDASNKKLCKYYETMNFKNVGIKALALGNYNLYQKELYSK